MCLTKVPTHLWDRQENKHPPLSQMHQTGTCLWPERGCVDCSSAESAAVGPDKMCSTCGNTNSPLTPSGELVTLLSLTHPAAASLLPEGRVVMMGGHVGTACMDGHLCTSLHA